MRSEMKPCCWLRSKFLGCWAFSVSCGQCRVSQAECEQIFFNQPLVTAEDSLHSYGESRHYALGQTDAGRLLFLVYTLREERIRVISARDMMPRERKEYEYARQEEFEADPEI